MASEPSSTPPVEDPPTDRRSNTGVNAIVGGVVGIVLSFVPFSPIVGGAAASYLNGGTTADGLRVGALAGLVMLVPLALAGVLLSTFLLGLGGSALGFLVVGLVVFVVAGVYTVGLSALGGYLGIYITDEA